MIDGEIDSEAQATGVYYVNTNVLATDQMFEIVAALLRIVLVNVGIFFSNQVAYPLDGFNGTYLFWEFVEVNIISVLFGLGLVVQIYRIIYAWANIVQFYPRASSNAWQFVKYAEITDFLKKDENGDNDINYWGLSAWIWNYVANPKAVAWKYDLIFIYCFAYLNYEAFSGFFIGALGIEVAFTSLLFNVYPHLDMPMMNWYVFWDNLINGFTDAESQQIVYNPGDPRYNPEPGVVVINGGPSQGQP